MASILTEDERKRLEANLAAAEPYDDDAPELWTLDGEVDLARMMATFAKKLLKMADEREQGHD